jgi:hypothetical protein
MARGPGIDLADGRPREFVGGRFGGDNKERSGCLDVGKFGRVQMLTYRSSSLRFRLIASGGMTFDRASIHGS